NAGLCVSRNSQEKKIKNKNANSKIEEAPSGGYFKKDPSTRLPIRPRSGQALALRMTVVSTRYFRLYSE
ncbi:MAG: hypothetical protein ACYSU4_21595, partial [Planctomycetota bacterium]